MVNVIINDIAVRVPEGTTIMEAAAKAGITIPSLCYLKEINEIGACRVCCVEVEGESRLVSSCNNLVYEGMVVHTNSPRAREARRTNVELLLSQHDGICAICVRAGNCKLQQVANDLGILCNPFEPDLPKIHWTMKFPLFRNVQKCIKCMRCIQYCEKVQTLGIWGMAGSGGRTTVDVTHNRRIKDSDCALCGQCITHCPVGALRERDDTMEVLDALADPEKITVVQIAPAVRSAWGEAHSLPREMATVRRLAAVLRSIGFDYIFDTAFSADLTIMEESKEFLERFTSGELKDYPMFTSCCPGWLRFIKSQYPQLTQYLSTAKSPQQMFGAITKSYFAEKIGVPPEKICCVSIMPCIAKKAEKSGHVFDTQPEGIQDVDIVLTTREMDRLIRSENINVFSLPEAEFDSPLGIGSGAGIIFGATGGVMEAALRTAYHTVTGVNPPADAFRAVRGTEGWREAEFDLNGATVRCAIASGLGNARKLVQALLSGEKHYDFVEIMACPGGCVGGGGQPIPFEQNDLSDVRGELLYKLDRFSPLRYSHENAEIKVLYDTYLGEPMSKRSEELLHTDHFSWEMPLSLRLQMQDTEDTTIQLGSGQSDFI
ncbi:MAG: [FeFe] hydrogenase, group A [Clostridia bacterium]|nr:[FeFe] hydrogenase, group A [Clostridia bacterium]